MAIGIYLVVQWSDLSIKIVIWLLHHQICTSVIDMGIKWTLFLIWRCKDYYGGYPLSISIYRVNPYFKVILLMTWNQSLHLRIDYWIILIPIPMKPVQFWRCKNWIFVDENKNPVTAPPGLHQHHWYGYQMNCIINLEVQGPYWRSSTLSINK